MRRGTCNRGDQVGDGLQEQMLAQKQSRDAEEVEMWTAVQRLAAAQEQGTADAIAAFAKRIKHAAR